MKNLYADAFFWGVINNLSQLCFGFAIYLCLGEVLSIEDFSKFILLAAAINVAFAFIDFRLQEVFVRDTELEINNLKSTYTQHVTIETFLRLVALLVASYPISYFLNITLMEYFFFGISFISGKIYTGVTSGFTKLTKTSIKLALLILVDMVPKLWFILFFNDVDFTNLSKFYVLNSIFSFLLFFLLFKSSFQNSSYENKTKRINKSKNYIYDNWKLSVSEIGIKELDTLVIAIFYPPIVVVTFRYAKLISGSIWRLIDSSMQIELMRRNIENDSNSQTTYNYKIHLTLYVIIICSLICFILKFLQQNQILFIKYDDLIAYLLLSSLWLLIAVHNYKSIASLQMKDQMKYVLFSLLISTTLYLATAIVGGTMSVLSLPISYSICMGAYFLLVTHFNCRVQRRE